MIAYAPWGRGHNKRHNKLTAKSDTDEFNRHFSDIATDSSYNDITIQNVIDTVEVDEAKYKPLHECFTFRPTELGKEDFSWS